jgi:hypothetical protein
LVEQRKGGASCGQRAHKGATVHRDSPLQLAGISSERRKCPARPRNDVFDPKQAIGFSSL